MARQNLITVVPDVRHVSASSEMVLAATPAGSWTAAAATFCSAGARFGMSARTCASSVWGVCTGDSCAAARRAGCDMASLYDAKRRLRTGVPGPKAPGPVRTRLQAAVRVIDRLPGYLADPGRRLFRRDRRQHVHPRGAA